jgi:PAS domain S-box-containing protein
MLLQAFDSAPTSLSVSDASGRIIGANRAFWNLFGHDPAVELFVSDLSRDADQEWTSAYLEQLVAGEVEEYQSGKRFVRADGSEFDGLVTVRAIHDRDRFVGMIASVEPVEIRPKVEDARIRKLLQHAAGTLTLIDPEGMVIETSGRYRTTLGYPSEYWESRTILDVLIPEDAERVLAMRDVVVNTPGHEVSGDFRVQGADGTIEVLEVVAVNMLHDPDLDGIVLSSRNVTHERAESAAVAQLRDEAVAEAERRSTLLATVSHELRNPLHAMSGMAELLASDDSLRSDGAELASTLHRQLLRLADVTDDLLDTARFDVGHFEIRPAQMVVRDLVDDVVMSARSAADGRLSVESTVADDIPFAVTTDPARLQQILGNLLGNAVKFTDEGGVGLTVQRIGESIEFAVSDTGRGIPPEQVGNVFHAFTTATTSGDRRGAGLGLAIVDRLVGALGGSIALETELGLGSTFRLTLPLGALTDTVDAAQPIDAATIDRRRRVLVVEDTPVNQDLARAQLDRLDMECVIAGSAEDALELLAADSFDVILMDHQLPGMNGRDATREIRQRGITTPVIGVTASSTAADERACLDAGMNAFLAKPVGLERLGAALHDVLTTRAASVSVDAAAEPDEMAAPTIDLRVLDELVDELGDRSIVGGLVGTFLDELDARSADIIGDDPDLAARQAHTLKSSARLLGAVRLSQACADAEHDADARSGIDELAASARTELRGWLAASDAATSPELGTEPRP